MKIVLASSEAVPFSKTGGLADVVSALAKALARRGHEVWLVVPFHRGVLPSGGALPAGETIEPPLAVPVGEKKVEGRIMRSRLPGSQVTCLLIDQPAYFDRAGLYQDPQSGGDYSDNCERFVFFSRAVLQALKALQIQPDILHANDWQTGLIPALLQAEERGRPFFARTGSVFTIHNMAFQGQFWHWDMRLTGLDWKYFNWKQMEFWGRLNLLKTGIVFADLVTTVSPTYAREIQTPEFGAGLEGVLRDRREDLVGILNGVDVELWNPETDTALPKNYSAETVLEGKAACKTALQREVRLPIRAEVPLFGMISRMTAQKGFDLLTACADDLMQFDVQLCFLGSGERKFERFVSGLSRRYPERVSATVGFDEVLAHRIEGGADAYLMPSRFEPCGLNQLYSLRYGTVPLVRAVGGLADSVVDTTARSLAERKATGFLFSDYTPACLRRQVQRAVQTYRQRRTWRQLAETGMRQDLSWNRSAAEYENVYHRARRKQTRAGG